MKSKEQREREAEEERLQREKVEREKVQAQRDREEMMRKMQMERLENLKKTPVGARVLADIASEVCMYVHNPTPYKHACCICCILYEHLRTCTV